MSAPVCPDPRIFPPEQQPDTRQFPSIPPAHNLSSALAAINAMRQLLDYLLNRQPQNNNGGGNTGQAKKGAQGKYSEVPGARKTQKVRVYNPNDKSQFVDVEQIVGLTMRDNKTGETWTWSR